MNVTSMASIYPEPPPLHTDEEVRAIGAPALKAGGPEGEVVVHWQSVWSLILAVVHFFGAPAAFYESCSHQMKDRRLALNYLRTLEAMIRRILLVMASADARPLEPWLPPKGRDQAKTGPRAPRAEYRGFAPVRLPIRFVLIPPPVAPPSTTKRVRPPAPIPDFLKEPIPPELDSPQTRRSERMMIADHRRDLIENKFRPVFALAARLEALIRVYKDPLPFVMRIRQRIAAEQSRHAEIVCALMLREPLRLSPGMVEELAETFWPACAAVRLLQKRGQSPPIAAA